jgi:phosphoglycerate dehydrogenase-like enzyme
MKFFGGRTVGLGSSPKKPEDVPFLDAYYHVDAAGGLDEFLAQCDVIIGVLPSTAATTGLLNGGKLRLCAERKPLLINIGRGTLVSEKDVLEALDSGWLRGAVLDVFSPEPLQKESLLWSHPNVSRRIISVAIYKILNNPALFHSDLLPGALFLN